MALTRKITVNNINWHYIFFRLFKMCKTWFLIWIRIRIWIGIKMESGIQIHHTGQECEGPLLI
jgi:hypothetical protein